LKKQLSSSNFSLSSEFEWIIVNKKGETHGKKNEEKERRKTGRRQLLIKNIGFLFLLFILALFYIFFFLFQIPYK